MGVYKKDYDNPHLTPSDKLTLLMNPLIIGKFKENSIKAFGEAKKRYPALSLHNDEGDAFRHCYWSALLTRDIGVLQTLSITNAHEDRKDNPPAEKEMDMYNNRQGIEIGIRNRDASDEGLAHLCQQALRAGKLKILAPKLGTSSA